MIYKTENHDLEDIYGLLDEFIDESVYVSGIRKDGIKAMVERPESLTIVVYDTEPVAIFMGYTYNHPMFLGKAASDLLMYVKPEKRGSPISMRLVKMYESWARKMDVNYIMLGQSTGIGNIDRVGKFYEKLGFQMTGFNLTKGI